MRVVLQLVPLFSRQSLGAPGSVGLSPMAVLPISVRSRIAGIPQNRVHTIAGEFAPFQISRPRTLPCTHREFPLLVAELMHHTHHRTGPPIGSKHLPDALLHLLIRVQNHLLVGIVEETCRQRTGKPPPPHLV